MASKQQRPVCVLGFYQTVVRDDGEISGGVLITSHLGRPIEFQCSLPIRPNKTQKTLYGSTLMPFLKGELVAEALFHKLQAKPDILLIDDPGCFSESVWSEVPVARFVGQQEDEGAASIHKHQLYVDACHQEKFAAIHERLAKHIPDSADLREPLKRIEEALQEALGIAA